MVGGVSSVLQGGKFGHGFFAAGVTQGFAKSINGISSARFSLGRIAAAAVIGGTVSKITGGKFANGATTGAFSRMFNDESHWQSLKRKASEWHYENRAEKNSNLPTYEQATGEGSQWQLLSKEQSIFHDDGIGKAELKFINADGREAVFNGDSLNLVTDPNYIGTYNYVNPAPVPSKWYDVPGWASYVGNGVAHVALDVVPYCMGGNVRGQGPSC